MPYRITPFVNQEIYHIYNRGSEKRVIFYDKRNYKRFLKTLRYYQLSGPKPKLSHFFKYQRFNLNQAPKIIEVLGYCLMPNHFHLLLKQIKDGGITETLTKLSLSYTKFFNTKYNRVGPLFQGGFKAVHIETDEQLIHVSRYIHLNPIVALLIRNIEQFEFSSYLEYIGEKEGICSTKEILNLFSSKEAYKEFVLDQIEYGQSLEKIKHQILEEI